MLKDKNILLGVTGGIAAYKTADLASKLIKQHANVDVIMTENATKFIAPLTFEALTHNRCVTDTFDRNHPWEVEHIALADKADVLVIAPATANCIAKLACGIADDMLTTTALACECPKIIAPAMNTKMYDNPVTQRNLATLKDLGYIIVEPDVGYLACGTVGKGRMEEPSRIVEAIIHEIAFEKDMKGLHVLVTAGPTREAIDPVRYITNHSTGKMGIALAKIASLRGAEVTLVLGKTDVEVPSYINKVDITSAKDMFDEVTKRADEQDIIIKAAAVADYTPIDVASEKIKKTEQDDFSIPLKRTDDILKWLGEHKRENQILCGFSMETENLLENSRKKLVKKNLDMICANNLKVEGAGFGVDTNVITLITKASEKELGLMSKDEASNEILSEILKMR
ncbi:bifunctional phosphopantothenoylcysteine decarboxylase/phosphopantothenate--cysteine ligase CoaBC [Butyrivibrio sp. YAB3001]|uniref:bifunctional phosphopantothenoylcysteine decarboxylase/phosphopantothenate--cysteine ligase CoaBC n=1 Tax=Butyrivibrio sp. YAB3001 TaxID=1520812 RepID=UPI0008F65221|nr:bifunctional phosphopantothenoylcysteine decarboxylase/phosphopantothenate--cysteine ligase CoaBC [Butyrivibrio sp. YAB3001]SFB76127.1 phosphopantothenoylcysteine decarboxylase / phosphopantothenate--cysteine ligase [Butyrivibrio sp. YAB3001]